MHYSLLPSTLLIPKHSYDLTAEPLVRTMDFAQQYTAAVDWESLTTCKQMLEATNAFMEDGTDVRLRMPGA